MRIEAVFVGLSAFLAATTNAQTTFQRRDASALGQLYAYGTNISGLALYYDSSTAYIGNTSIINSTTFSNLNCMNLHKITHSSSNVSTH